jgi:hypothetical protein
MSPSQKARAIVAAVLALVMVAGPAVATTGSTGPTAPGSPPPPAEKALTTVPVVADPDAVRRTTPEDRYAMALGCYELTSLASGEAFGRHAAGYGASASASPFHFEPTDLGTYLLLDSRGDVLSAQHGPAEEGETAVDAAEYVTPVDRTTDLPRSFDDRLPSPAMNDPVSLVPVPDTHPGAIVPGEAGPSADWRAHENVDGSFTFTLEAASGRALAVIQGVPQLADAVGAGAAARFALRAVDESGCAEWPEIDIDVTGPVLAGAAPWDETRGIIDAHLHLMAFEFLGGEFRCGRPWHRYGVTEALRDCSQNEFAGGRLAEAGFGDGPDNFGDDVFWPEFTVPTPRSKTYEQVYHRWLERAWRSGLRMMTVLLVENNVLCEAWPDKRNSCDEMDSVRLQAQRLGEFVDYIDARSGGPGEGWAQIATDPFEARKIVNEGRLALIMGIEVSVLFNCREYLGTSQCTNADIVRQLDEVQELGVVQMEIVNKFDNALSGVKGDEGRVGVVVNQGNLNDTGHFWKMATCPENRAHGEDKHQINVPESSSGTPIEPFARDALAAAVLSATGTSGAAPLYPEGPHCNTTGLTEQGEFVLREIAARGMLFDPDHMSAVAAMRALDVLDGLDYTGIVSSHGWADDVVYERIYELGGTVTQYAGGSEGFLNNYRRSLDWVDDRYYFGFGYGADTNGLGGQGTARNPGEDDDVDYPFVVPGGAIVDRQSSGVREPYDINTDGVAHYGLYPDWLEDLRVQDDGGTIIEDMLRGPEAYLQVWERAVGVPEDFCIFGDGSTDPTDAVEDGMTFDQVLRVAGQPHLRTAEGYTYCGLSSGGRPVHVVVHFGEDGQVENVTESPANGPLPAINPPRRHDGALTTRTDVAAHSHGDGDDHDHDHDHDQTAPVLR